VWLAEQEKKIREKKSCLEKRRERRRKRRSQNYGTNHDLSKISSFSIRSDDDQKDENM
jgi:hypothetical protein